MKQQKYENRKQLISAGIWSLAVLAVVAVGMLTFFSSASRATKEQEKNPAGNTVSTSDISGREERAKTTKESEAGTDTEAEAGFFKPANPVDTAVPDVDAVKPDTERTDAAEDAAAILPDSDALPVSETLPAGTPLRCVMPVDGTVTKDFTDEIAVYSLTMNDYRVHNGIDIYAPVGTNVKACAAGVVERVWEDPFMGCCVEINHGGGMKSLYANLSAERPRGMEAGATVLAGDVIGGVGSTMIIEMADTDHLHFSMSQDGVYLDPLAYMTNYQGGTDADYEN